MPKNSGTVSKVPISETNVKRKTKCSAASNHGRKFDSSVSYLTISIRLRDTG